ncbi:BAG family molecular chaperone regulator 4-like isoform X1 [Dreissena polymorpha]|nr:BAG family molecular chaperone regulator 4-like isoform X1 [Dreissena polymorpha]
MFKWDTHWMGAGGGRPINPHTGQVGGYISPGPGGYYTGHTPFQIVPGTVDTGNVSQKCPNCKNIPVNHCGHAYQYHTHYCTDDGFNITNSTTFQGYGAPNMTVTRYPNGMVCQSALNMGQQSMYMTGSSMYMTNANPQPSNYSPAPTFAPPPAYSKEPPGPTFAPPPAHSKKPPVPTIEPNPFNTNDHPPPYQGSIPPSATYKM